MGDTLQSWQSIWLKICTQFTEKEFILIFYSYIENALQDNCISSQAGEKTSNSKQYKMASQSKYLCKYLHEILFYLKNVQFGVCWNLTDMIVGFLQWLCILQVTKWIKLIRKNGFSLLVSVKYVKKSTGKFSNFFDVY
jgi:hypothetical protein